MISKKTIAAIELCTCLARRRNRGCTTTLELTAELGLTVSYLEKIIKPLKEHGVVSATKGPGGGYQIRGDLTRISMWDIAVAFEQTLGSAEDADAAEDAESAHAGRADYELGLEQIVKETLSRFALADFVSIADDAKPFGSEVGRFKLKPMAVPFMPKAPNSVFQLSSAF